MIAARLQERSAFCIVLTVRFLRMLGSVKLHDQLCAVTDEVYGISLEWCLPTEVDTFVLKAAQESPEQPLRIGCRLS